MGAQDQYIAGTVYCDTAGSNRWVRDVIELAVDECMRVERQVTHLDIIRRDEQAIMNGVKIDRKPGRRPRRASKASFDALAREECASMVRVCDLYSVGDDEDFMMSPVLIGAADRTDSMGYTQLHFQRLMTAGMEESAADVVRMISRISTSLKIVYGIVDVMTGWQYPTAYFANAPLSTHLSAAQDASAVMWRQRERECATVIRGMYWINVLTAGHYGGVKTSVREKLAAIGGAIYEHEELLIVVGPAMRDSTQGEAFAKCGKALLNELNIKVLEP